MIDLNKVLQGLKNCQNDSTKCSKCPYYRDCMTSGWFSAIHSDAANLIELQDEMLKKANALLQEALRLLKEQNHTLHEQVEWMERMAQK